MSDLRTLQKVVAPLVRKLRLMVGRAVLEAADDSGGMQRLKVELFADEVHDQVEHFQSYGFTSVPLPGAEGIHLAVGGARDQGVVIAVGDRRCRLKGLAGGEVALYDDQGSKLVLKRGGSIVVTPSGSGKVKLGGDDATLAVARVTDVSVAHADLVAWMTQVTLALGAMAPQFNGPPTTPIVAIGPLSVVPPVTVPTNVGVINQGASKAVAS